MDTRSTKPKIFSLPSSSTDRNCFGEIEIANQQRQSNIATLLSNYVFYFYNSTPHTNSTFPLLPQCYLQLVCLCNSRYIGRTFQSLPEGIKQHISKFYSFVGNVVEWLKRRDRNRHGLGSKPTRVILLCPWERHFTALSPA